MNHSVRELMHDLRRSLPSVILTQYQHICGLGHRPCMIGSHSKYNEYLDSHIVYVDGHKYNIQLWTTGSILRLSRIRMGISNVGILWHVFSILINSIQFRTTKTLLCIIPSLNDHCKIKVKWWSLQVLIKQLVPICYTCSHVARIQNNIIQALI